jgi:hypothetical protein
MSLIFPLAMEYNDASIGFSLGVTNKCFANAIAPLLMSEKHNRRGSKEYYHVFYFAKILSDTYIYSPEISFPHCVNDPLEWIGDDIMHMMPVRITGEGVSFYTFHNFINETCLKELSIDDSETIEKKIQLKNFDKLTMILCDGNQDFEIAGIFGIIDFYIQHDYYIKNLHKIVEKIDCCQDLDIMYEEGCYQGTEFEDEIDLSFALNHVKLSLERFNPSKYLQFMSFNESLKKLEIWCDDNFLEPLINDESTTLRIITSDRHKKLIVKINEIYANKKINIETNSLFLRIINTGGEDVNVVFFKTEGKGKVKCDNEAKNVSVVFGGKW